ncbi:MAG: anaerobic ribonucleoside-triphosphate reductase activating protein [Puniceicoccales bacterium]|jgi:pyruvate formate lyase activating enzyme|nr:anaerobic ribonucleoside-triphosphate reductase activating protein [Puniceicoccales bacterium]
MKIGGLQRLSMIDFPGKLATVVFTIDCNFCCPFCHNPKLVEGDINLFPEESLWDFLSTRTKLIEGVVVSGGEPTLHRDLPTFIKKIKALGFSVKLDTNGSNPEMLSELINAQLLDFVAMDIKHIWSRYAFSTGLNIAPIEKIQQSAIFLLNSHIDYEFRTTVIKDFHDPMDIINISRQICGAKRYAVQEFIPKKTLSKDFAQKLPFEKQSLEALIPEISKYVQSFEIRQ